MSLGGHVTDFSAVENREDRSVGGFRGCFGSIND